MAVCAPATPSLDICPSQDQIRDQLLALLPRGRAWANDDGGPWPDQVLYQVFDALAAARLFIEQRICDLRREFLCATTSELRDAWLADYGLPDGCEPYPDLCDKVAADDGQTCGEIADICAAAGWSVTCLASEQCGTRSGSLSARAGCAMAGGGLYRARITLEVDLEASSAFVGDAAHPSLAGRMRAGWRQSCPPDISALKCLVARIAPAHVQQVFVLGEAGIGLLDFEISGNPLIAIL